MLYDNFSGHDKKTMSAFSILDSYVIDYMYLIRGGGGGGGVKIFMFVTKMVCYFLLCFLTINVKDCYIMN